MEMEFGHLGEGDIPHNLSRIEWHMASCALVAGFRTPVCLYTLRVGAGARYAGTSCISRPVLDGPGFSHSNLIRRALFLQPYATAYSRTAHAYLRRAISLTVVRADLMQLALGKEDGPMNELLFANAPQHIREPRRKKKNAPIHISATDRQIFEQRAERL